VPDGSAPVFDPRRILLTLADYRVDFVVVGGIAVQAHGHGRSTRDLDVMPRPDLANLSRLGEALGELGARLLRGATGVDVTDPQILGRVPHAPLLTAHGRLDVLNCEHTSGAPAYDDLRRRSSAVEVDGAIVRVAGLDDLLRMKRAAGRDIDLDDIGALTRTEEELEREMGEST
jgi:hypothetical protein